VRRLLVGNIEDVQDSACGGLGGGYWWAKEGGSVEDWHGSRLWLLLLLRRERVLDVLWVV